MFIFYRKKYTPPNAAIFSGSSGGALGGAIYGSSVTISNNSNVIFEKNYERQGAYRMRSIYSTGAINLSAPTDREIEFRDSIYSGSSLSINKIYSETKQTGDVIFTGSYTSENLRNLKLNFTNDELQNSLTTNIIGLTSVYDGRLIIKEGVIFQGGGLEVKSSVSKMSTPTVVLEYAQLNHHNAGISFASGTVFELKGQNSVNSNTLTMGSGSQLTLHAGSGNQDTAILNYSGVFYFGNQLTLNVDLADNAEQSVYKLVTLSTIGDMYNWTSDKVTVNGIDGLAVIDLAKVNSCVIICQPWQKKINSTSNPCLANSEKLIKILSFGCTEKQNV